MFVELMGFGKGLGMPVATVLIEQSVSTNFPRFSLRWVQVQPIHLQVEDIVP